MAATVPSTHAMPNKSKKLSLFSDSLTVHPNHHNLELKGVSQISSDSFHLKGLHFSVNFQQQIIATQKPFFLRYQNQLILGESLFLNLKQKKLFIKEPTLSIKDLPPEITIKGNSLSCTALQCTLNTAYATLCPHQPTGYHISADKVVLQSSGDIDLFRPLLKIGSVPFFKLPWLRIRPSNKPGFFPPSLGWTEPSGLLLTLGTHIPLRENAFYQQFVTGRFRQGLSTASTIVTPEVDLTLYTLANFPERAQFIRANFESANRLRAVDFNIKSDISTNFEIIDTLAFDPFDKIAKRHWSHARFTYLRPNLILESSISYPQTFQATGQINPSDSAPIANLNFQLLPNHHSYLMYAIETSISTVQNNGYIVDGFGHPTTAHTRFELAPSLSIPLKLSILSTRLETRAIASNWQYTVGNASGQSLTTITTASLELPLLKRVKAHTHVLTPFFIYTAIPFFKRNSLAPVFPTNTQPTGHGVEVGVSQRFGRAHTKPLITVLASQIIALKGFNQDTQLKQFFLNFTAGRHWLLLKGNATWNEPGSPLAGVLCSLSSHNTQNSGFATQMRYHSPNALPFAQSGLNMRETFFPYKMKRIAGHQLDLEEMVEFNISPNIVAYGNGTIGIRPKIELLILSYGLAFNSKCRCIGVLLNAAHRFRSPVPDLMVTFKLSHF